MQRFRYRIGALDPERQRDRVSELRNLLGPEHPGDDFDFLFVVGGDGSLIHFAREYAFFGKDILGISSGNLSFLCMGQGEPNIPHPRDADFGHYYLLGIDSNGVIRYAANDLYICGNSFLELTVKINGDYFQRFRGTALLFSTELGSTAHNRSLSGPIIRPGLGAWIMNGVAPQVTDGCQPLLNPLILGLGDVVSLDIGGEFMAYLDGAKFDLGSGGIVISLHQSTSRLCLSTIHQKYYGRLSDFFTR